MVDQDMNQSTDYVGQMIIFGVKCTWPDFFPFAKRRMLSATPLRPANAALKVCDVGERLLEARDTTPVFEKCGWAYWRMRWAKSLCGSLFVFVS